METTQQPVVLTPSRRRELVVSVLRGVRGLGLTREVRGAGQSHKLLSDGATPSPATNPNHRHAAATVLRTARLTSVGNWLVSEDVRHLDKLKAKICEAIKSVNPTGAGSDAQQQARAVRLVKVTDAAVKDAFSTMASDALARADQLGQVLHQGNASKLKEHHGITSASVGADAGAVLVLGAPLKEHYEFLGTKLAFAVRTAIRAGVKNHESAADICSRLDGGNPAVPVKASAEIQCGDVAGHEFHGNQYSEIAGVRLPNRNGDASVAVWNRMPKIEKAAAIKSVHESAGHYLKSNGLEDGDHTFSFRAVNLGDIKPTQHGEDRLNESSRETALQISKSSKTGSRTTLRDEDVHPILVHGPTGKILDGNHRFTAAEINKQKTIQAVIINPVHPVKAAAATPEGAAKVDKSLSVGVRIFDGTENSIAKVIQAAVNALANAADEASMDEDEGAETGKRMGWLWNAISDLATCPACEYYDGMVWDEDFQPANDDTTEFPGTPPSHVNCRCSVTPIDLDQPVPENVSFGDYLAQFSKEEKEQAFGKDVYARWQKGDISDAELASQKENLLTLEQFKEAELK